MPGDPGLNAGNQFAEHQVPFFAGEPRRIVPTLLLRDECHVGPVVVAVRRKIDPLRRRRTKLREMRGKIEHGHDAYTKLIRFWIGVGSSGTAERGMRKVDSRNRSEKMRCRSAVIRR